MSVHSIDEKRPRVTRDIVVIGGSAGGFVSLKHVLGALPEDCPAAVFVVLHVAEERESIAAEILEKHCALPVRFGEDTRTIEHGTVTIAQRGAHLMLGTDEMYVRRGPRENGFRPAIDPLFRSAAVHHGGRTIGMILSGSLDDGASGARALSRIGVPILVEDPGLAEYAQMPQATFDLVDDARPLANDALGPALVELIGTPGRDAVEVPEDVRLELMVSTLEKAHVSTEERLGTLTPFNCPDCDGVLWEIEDGRLVRYRCHTGHAYTSEILASVQETAVERTLYEALRAQRGRAHLLRTMAERSSDPRLRDRYTSRADGYDEDSTTIETLLLARPA